MKRLKASNLVAFCKKAYNESWGYVWGGRGKLYNKKEAKFLYSTFHTNKYNKTYYYKTQMKRWGGHKVADCSGLLEAFRKKDATAEMLFRECNKTSQIKNFDDTPGTLLFVDTKGRKVHVGVAIGNGYVIHSKNSAVGVVKEKITNYKWTHYGVPKWILFDISQSNYFSQKTWIKMIQKEFGVQTDGIAGTQTLLHSKTLKQGMKGNLIKLVQKKLIAEGYSVGVSGADGIFGTDTKNGVINYQKANSCIPDGVITARAKTWKTLLNI